MNLFMRSEAVLSDCGRYRYTLTRHWDDALPRLCWLMANPSTADDSQDDPTITRVLGFTEKFGCGSLVVVNLFAWRSTDPKELLAAADPVGPANDRHIREQARGRRVIAAWGACAGRLLKAREAAVLALLQRDGVRPECLGLTQDCHPLHPLFLKGDTRPVPFLPARWRKAENFYRVCLEVLAVALRGSPGFAKDDAEDLYEAAAARGQLETFNKAYAQVERDIARDEETVM